MAATVLLYDPTAPRSERPQQSDRILTALAGKVVGFIDNAKPNFNYLVDDLGDLLMKKHGVKQVLKDPVAQPAWTGSLDAGIVLGP